MLVAPESEKRRIQEQLGELEMQKLRAKDAEVDPSSQNASPVSTPGSSRPNSASGRDAFSGTLDDVWDFPTTGEWIDVTPMYANTANQPVVSASHGVPDGRSCVLLGLNALDRDVDELIPDPEDPGKNTINKNKNKLKL